MATPTFSEVKGSSVSDLETQYTDTELQAALDAFQAQDATLGETAKQRAAREEELTRVLIPDAVAAGDATAATTLRNERHQIQQERPDHDAARQGLAAAAEKVNTAIGRKRSPIATADLNAKRDALAKALQAGLCASEEYRLSLEAARREFARAEFPLEDARNAANDPRNVAMPPVVRVFWTWSADYRGQAIQGA